MSVESPCPDRCNNGLARRDAAVAGEGLIIDRRPHVPVARTYEVREVTVDARVRDQVAEVQVSQTFHNPGSFQLEAEYLFPLPEDGAIQNFVLLVDGKELPGRLLPKDEARRIYEEIVRTKRDPALLEYMGRGLYPHQRLPDPAGGRPQGHDAVHPALQARPRRRRVRLSASAPRSSPPSRSSGWRSTVRDPRARTRSSRSTAPATTPTIRPRRATTRRASRSSSATSSRRPTSASSTPWPKGRSGPRS